MSSLVLDTNIVSYLMRGHALAERYRPHLEGHILMISFITVAEMHEGALRDGWGQAKMERLARVLAGYHVSWPDNAMCLQWAQIRFLRRSRPISPQDAWVAATAMVSGSPLVTHNPDDFEGIPGLKVISEYRRQ